MLDVMSPYSSFIDEPNSDAIEMFCGQIPRTMSEKDLRQLFGNYGRIYKLNILRDRQNGQSKGCCFLTYYTRQSALNAQNALHNLMILPGMHHAIQMKPADLENRNERKIFIGMISKASNEEDIKQLFLPFGIIEECTVLRDSNNRSRGCAFVTYQKRQSAFNAIKTMHHSCTMDGCSSPVNVRFADTPKDKEVRKIQQKFHDNLLQQITTHPSETNENFTSLNLMLFNQLYSNAVTRVHTQSSSTNNNDLSCGDNNANNPLPLSNVLTSKLNNDRQNNIFPLPLPSATKWQSVGTIGHSPRSSSMHETTDENHGIIKNTSLSYRADQNIGQQHLINNKDVFPSHTNFLINPEINPRMWSNSTDDDLRLLDNSLSPIAHSLTPIGNLSLSNHTHRSRSLENLTNQQNNNNSQLINRNSEKQLIGPLGSNLFIYHLPSEFTDHDLAQTFSPFGNILSAKVFIDKLTLRSKCFGFVSYDNIYSAHQAIKQMNGFQIGFKRLKVQLKKARLY